MAKTKTLRARVLTDNAGFGILCNQIVEGPEHVIKALHASGAVDSHPDAVAYAVGIGAQTVALPNPDGAEQLAAALTTTEGAGE